jgi:hypothetical protein
VPNKKKEKKKKEVGKERIIVNMQRQQPKEGDL